MSFSISIHHISSKTRRKYLLFFDSVVLSQCLGIGWRWGHWPLTRHHPGCKSCRYLQTALVPGVDLQSNWLEMCLFCINCGWCYLCQRWEVT